MFVFFFGKSELRFFRDVEGFWVSSCWFGFVDWVDLINVVDILDGLFVFLWFVIIEYFVN